MAKIEKEFFSAIIYAYFTSCCQDFLLLVAALIQFKTSVGWKCDIQLNKELSLSLSPINSFAC